MLGFLAQLSDRFGDDGEPASLLARAGGFDRCVECQQVGLLGDSGDRLHDRADLLGLSGQFGDRISDLELLTETIASLASSAALTPARATSRAAAAWRAISADCATA